MFGEVVLSLRTFSLLKNLPVFELASGDKLGEVCDLTICETNQVKGLLVRRGTIIRNTGFLPLNKIISFGSDGVMVKLASNIEQITNKTDYTLDHFNRLFGKELLTAEGDRLGLLEDVYFSAEMGTIIGYELTDGFFADLVEGKRVIKCDEPVAFGTSVIIVNNAHDLKGD